MDALLTLTKKNLKGIAVSNVVFVNEKETMASSTTIRSPTSWNFMGFTAKETPLRNQKLVDEGDEAAEKKLEADKEHVARD